MSDVSSAEEETKRRFRVRHKQKRKHQPAAELKVPDVLDDMAEYTTMEEEDMPKLKSIQEFAQQHAHTAIPIDQQKPMCEEAEPYMSQSMSLFHSIASSAPAASAAAAPASASSSSSSSSSGLIPDVQARLIEEQKRACNVKPAQSFLYTRLVNQLWNPVFYCENAASSSSSSNSAFSAMLGESEDQTSQRLQEALRRRQVHLPIMPASLESELLAEGGKFIHCGREYDFPKCVNGNRCIAMQIDFPLADPVDAFRSQKPQRFILTSLMFKEEYEAFILNRTPPSCIRPCIACCRNTLVQIVAVTRYTNACASASAADGDNTNNIDHSVPRVQIEVKKHVFQLYRNLVDQQNGYFKEYMFIPKIGDEAVIDPICLLSKQSLMLRVTKEGRRYLDQSRIVYQPPRVPIPRIGESLQVFS